MVKISVLDPNEPGSHFDMDYYCAVHIPMAKKLLAPALKGRPGGPGHLWPDAGDASVVFRDGASPV